jgi:hypothetical protein
MLNPVLELTSSDVKLMIKKLKDIEPDALKRYRAEIKRIAKPIADQIQQQIPDRPPLSGMGFVINRTSKRTGRQSYVINNGRLNWQGTGNYEKSVKLVRGPKSVQVSSAIKPSGKSLTTPIAKVIVMSPAVAMADMAGSGSSGKSGVKSREYPYRKRNGEIVMRRHRVNGQGKNMIEYLQQRHGTASRFAWSGLERRIDDAAREIDKILQTYFDKAFGVR